MYYKVAEPIYLASERVYNVAGGSVDAHGKGAAESSGRGDGVVSDRSVPRTGHCLAGL